MTAGFFADGLKSASFPLRALFYLVTPSETSPISIYDENALIYDEIIPYVVLLIALEIMATLFLSKGIYKVNDVVTSLSARFFSLLPGIATNTLPMAAYLYIQQHYSIYLPDVHSIWTWLVAVLGVDFCFYWFHRCAHEINILWTFHQTHHSSEYFHLVTALRFPLIADFLAEAFSLPLAFFVPFPIYLLHNRLNFFYQVWIHTAFVRDLGPIEWIFNTPKHHRIHHGSNPYCIDKNYAGFLIIWDRLFGTFASEKEGETIQFGLVGNIKTFDFLYIQLGAIYEVFGKLIKTLRLRKCSASQKVANAFKAVFYGPGWTPRKPNFRLGDPKDLPPANPDHIPFNPVIPLWQNVYCVIHFTLIALMTLAYRSNYLQKIENYIVIGSYVASCCSFGYIFNRKSFASYFECSRCLIFAIGLGYLRALPHDHTLPFLLSVLRLFYIISIFPWILFSRRNHQRSITM